MVQWGKHEIQNKVCLSVPFLPSGPQSMVSLEHVDRAMKQPLSPNRQWEQCHKQSFKTSLYSDNYPRAVAGVIYKALQIPGTKVDIGSIKNKCTKQKVIMACKRVGTRFAHYLKFFQFSGFLQTLEKIL